MNADEAYRTTNPQIATQEEENYLNLFLSNILERIKRARDRGLYEVSDYTGIAGWETVSSIIARLKAMGYEVTYHPCYIGYNLYIYWGPKRTAWERFWAWIGKWNP